MDHDDPIDELAIFRAEMSQHLMLWEEMSVELYQEFLYTLKAGFTRPEALQILIAKYFLRPV